MKIWITRSSAFSIQCGGLERLFVWFREPVWVEYWRERSSYDLPFGYESEMNGAKTAEWQIRRDGSMWIDRPVSFGKLFGYNDRKDENENRLSEHVWEKVCEHFGSVDFDKWHEYENERPECSIKNFLLEVDLKITFE